MTGQQFLMTATALGCVTAAGVGGYLAVRTSSVDSAAAAVAPTVAASQPDVETNPEGTPTARPDAGGRQVTAPLPTRFTGRPVSKPEASVEASVAPSEASAPVETPAQPTAPGDRPNQVAAQVEPTEVQPVVDEFEVPEDAVVGIRLETAVSTETSAVEDRVVGRVTRAVTVGNRTVIPAGAELVGYVTSVERGGKVRDRARIGVKFTSLLVNKVRTPIQTEALYRLGDSPRGEAAAKIGGSAVVGSIIGGMIGGKKGAAIGGTAGAAGGTAVVMKGDPNPAVFAAGTSLTVRLTAPVKIRVER